MAVTNVTNTNTTFDVATPNLGATSGTTAHTFFGPFNRAYTITASSYIISAQGGSGATINIFHDSGTQAPGAGTSILTGGTALDLHALAVNTATTNALTATSATLALAAGDRLSYQLAGTLTALADLVLTVTVQPA